MRQRRVAKLDSDQHPETAHRRDFRRAHSPPGVRTISSPVVAARSYRRSRTITFRAARPAAHESGWPPKVVICPSGGSCGELAEQIVAAAQCAQRQPAAERLGDHDDVGHDAEMLEREQLAGAAESGQHLVEDEHRTRPIASLAQRPHESGLRYAHAALGLHRLDHHRRDRSNRSRRSGRPVIIRQMPHRAGQRLERLRESRGFPASASAPIVSP